MNSGSKRKGLGAEAAANRDPTALAHAVDLIFGTCCLAGAPSVIADFSDEDKLNAIGEHDTAALFNLLVRAFSHQGTSDVVAHDYMQRHGTPTWRSIESELSRVSEPSCEKLGSYWQFSQCRYDKTSRTCSEPDHLDDCPLPTHRLRNGRLNQMAYSLFLFMRDIAAGDFVGWINDQLATVPASNHSTLDRQEALIGPLRNVYAVSDKVLTMALSGLLIAGSKHYPAWLEVGVGMVAVDTLVHNYLHRTGILDRFDAAHQYGPRCYQAGYCADILQVASRHIDARQFDPGFPAAFPRFVQHAVWRYCSKNGRDICNGNRINDRVSCDNVYCQLTSICDKASLNPANNERLYGVL
jgi:hypothetical protein